MFYNTRVERLANSSLDLLQIDKSEVFDNSLEKKVDNPIMIIGEAPGGNEVEQKKPFVGLAGKNLSECISYSDKDREKHFLITNAFPFRTFEKGSKGIKNRTPNKDELFFGATLLLEEIAIVKPKLILLLGGSAKKAFLKLKDSSATKSVASGENHTTFNCFFETIDFQTRVGLSFHPSPLVYNTKAKRETLQQFFLRL